MHWVPPLLPPLQRLGRPPREPGPRLPKDISILNNWGERRQFLTSPPIDARAHEKRIPADARYACRSAVR